MKKKLQTQLETFLSKRVKIQPGYEQAQADPKDVEILERIIAALCEAKWEPSYEGVVPVQIEVINRSTHEQLNYVAQPYSHKGATFEQRFHIAKLNLALAAQEIDRLREKTS